MEVTQWNPPGSFTGADYFLVVERFEFFHIPPPPWKLSFSFLLGIWELQITSESKLTGCSQFLFLYSFVLPLFPSFFLPSLPPLLLPFLLSFLLFTEQHAVWHQFKPNLSHLLEFAFWTRLKDTCDKGLLLSHWVSSRTSWRSPVVGKHWGACPTGILGLQLSFLFVSYA